MKRFIFSIITLCAVHSLQAQFFTAAERNHILQGDTSKMIRVTQNSIPAEDKILNTVSTDISWQDTLLPVLKARMLYSMLDPNNEGVGIAAPQVGINRNVFWVQRFDKIGEPYEFYINPKIIWYSQLKQLGPEGCLSVADRRGNVMRSYAIQVAYTTLEGSYCTETIEGFTAVIFQHEMDHLNGTLFIERLSEQEQKVYKPAKNNLYQE